MPTQSSSAYTMGVVFSVLFYFECLSAANTSHTMGVVFSVSNLEEPPCYGPNFNKRLIWPDKAVAREAFPSCVFSPSWALTGWFSKQWLMFNNKTIQLPALPHGFNPSFEVATPRFNVSPLHGSHNSGQCSGRSNFGSCPVGPPHSLLSSYLHKSP